VPKAALTDAGLQSLKPLKEGHLDVWDTTLPSFGVRVSPKGTKTFILKLDNSRRAIGRFPIISLSKARTEAKRLLAERTLGKVRPTSITFPTARDLFIEDKVRGNKPGTAAEYKRLLARLKFKCQLSELTPHEFARVLNRFTSPSERDHLLVAAKVFFNWAMKRHYIERNPALGLSPHPTSTRSRVLTDEELGRVWRAAERTEGHFGTIVKLLILTGARRGEIAALRADYISHDTCTLPATLTKNKREHTFPIENLTAALLCSVLPTSTTPSTSEMLLFPARGSSSSPFNGWSKSKAALDKLSGVSGWTLHDLRRTFATRLAELGVAPHVIERLLNHVTGTMSPLARVYNRAKYLEEMRHAIGLWEQYLQEKVL
jgi:integrase